MINGALWIAQIERLNCHFKLWGSQSCNYILIAKFNQTITKDNEDDSEQISCKRIIVKDEWFFICIQLSTITENTGAALYLPSGIGFGFEPVRIVKLIRLIFFVLIKLIHLEICLIPS